MSSYLRHLSGLVWASKPVGSRVQEMGRKGATHEEKESRGSRAGSLFRSAREEEEFI